MPFQIRVILPLVAAAFAAASLGGVDMNPSLTSSAFTHQGAIPTKYTCEGADISPPLSWTNLPPGTKSLALIVDDPDAPDPAAPKMTWVHWCVSFQYLSGTIDSANSAAKNSRYATASRPHFRTR